MQQSDSEVAKVIQAVVHEGSYSDKGFTLSADVVTSEVSVREIKTGFLVAYSSTKADYGQSLEEFAGDFFGPQ